MFVFDLTSINDIPDQALNYYDYLMQEKCKEYDFAFTPIKGGEYEWFFHDYIWDTKILSNYNYDHEKDLDIDFLNYVKNCIDEEVQSELKMLIKNKNARDGFGKMINVYIKYE